MDTNISKVIDITSDSAKYDASIKEMLADIIPHTKVYIG